MNNLIKYNSDKISLHEHKIVSSIENDGINIRELICVMNERLVCGFVYTIQYYFNSNSYLYVKSIVKNMESLIRKLSPTHIDDKVLIEYQNKQLSKAPASFRVLRPFLIKWFEFGYPGIDESAVELLKHLDLKIKKAGQSVLQDDPTEGPLTKEEHTSLIKAMNHAYRIGVLSLSDYAISLLMSLTGRRPQQLVTLKYKDLLQKKLDNGKIEYLISVPRVKQRGKQLQYRELPIISEVASIVQLQANHSVRLVEQNLGKTLDDHAKGKVPVFLNEEKLLDLAIIDFNFLESNKIYAKPTIANQALKNIVNTGNLISNRTGALLNVTPRRLRYTIATMLAKDGYNANTIAELLDHSSTSSTGIYIKNLAESVERIDSAVSEQLSFIADIFMNGIRSNKIRDFKFCSSRKCQNQNLNVSFPCDKCAFFMPIDIDEVNVL
ncbi:tyrosine-type recombinase/integrase [Salmonella enterica subsp. enterica serovar Concord]|uniref:Site-specific integrase n=1 Tax=Salmonella enterica subsp. enterica serovar Concord TaxID=483687 RepID=A0A636CX83_SALET|nr:site-specific integrase [Salmonella enterica subsp. enterica serovar Concord]EDH9738898.1 site-specific integrase [Salmonella enterica subsp. enterica serovar Concord]EEF8273408.1 tyrosine-type recombinase/integrase [Salmonella enterica subsp. enterica serovar Concord]EGD0418254.1 tyrosine-type recombinase/integrase [Salmonella enterica subsp. enterica serovar Concord]EGF4689192.1 tyrosine-type recombinase/integrase [Salmonella enterica subsp. enterica serovar Concord]